MSRDFVFSFGNSIYFLASLSREGDHGVVEGERGLKNTAYSKLCARRLPSSIPEGAFMVLSPHLIHIFYAFALK